MDCCEVPTCPDDADQGKGCEEEKAAVFADAME